jgi:hypothetical protein
MAELGFCEKGKLLTVYRRDGCGHITRVPHSSSINQIGALKSEEIGVQSPRFRS